VRRHKSLVEILCEAITAWLDRRALRRISETLWKEYEDMTARKHTMQCLQKLLTHLEEMVETVQLAMTGDQRAIDEVMSEYAGRYTKVQSLAADVGGGEQQDDDDDFARQEEREEAIRACSGERP
jgi:hypothetical protein